MNGLEEMKSEAEDLANICNRTVREYCPFVESKGLCPDTCLYNEVTPEHWLEILKREAVSNDKPTETAAD